MEKPLTGERLRHFCMDELTTRGVKKQRTLWKSLHKYCKGRNDGKVAILSGLRRTGKSTLMLQEIQRLGDFDHSLLVQCSAHDKNSIDEFLQLLEAHQDKKYIFIDEATMMRDFIGVSNLLTDRYSLAGQKIVLSGTDSLSFAFAVQEPLYDRAHLFRTTYIPYSEFHHIFTKDLDEYIRYGGTMTDGHTIYHDGDSLSKYANTAIINNIQRSFQYWDLHEWYPELHEIIERHQLPTYVNKNLQNYNRKFVARAVRKAFEPADLDLMIRNLRRRNPPVFAQVLKTDELIQDIKTRFQVQDLQAADVKDESLHQIEEYLEALDLIYRVPNSDEVVFLQPGMRYCLAEETVHALKNSDAFYGFSNEERSVIIDTIDQSVKGQIMEEVIYYQMMTDSQIKDTYNTGKYRDNFGREVDVVLIDRHTGDAILMEVKHTEACVPGAKGQTKHLENSNVCHEIEQRFGGKIRAKIVLYKGKNKFLPNGISYLHTENFLCRPAFELSKAIQHFEDAHIGRIHTP